MIYYTEKQELHTVQEFDHIQCDICKESYTDMYEVEEFSRINFVGGYGSIFGDGVEIEADVCQYCLYDFIKDHVRVISGDEWGDYIESGLEG